MNVILPAERRSPNRTESSRSACQRALLAASLASAITAASVVGAAAQESDPTLWHDANGLKVRWHFQLGLNAVAETNLFWDLGEFAAPESGFESDTQWLESYAKPGLSVQKSLGRASALTGKVTGVMSYTLGTHAFDSRNMGRVTLEEAYLRFSTVFANGVAAEFSAGGQFLTADLAHEWNPGIDLSAWAGRVQAGYAFAGVRGAPALTYGLQVFSGDDPNTTKLERFDPLYYDGAPSAWATGSKSAMMFINSNVRSHNVAFRLAPRRKDVVTFRYAHVRASELCSPVRFGQATRLDLTDEVGAVISGVTDAHLSDDGFIEYFRAINRYPFLTAGFSVARPGKGITAVAGLDPVWTGRFVNVVFNF